MPEFKLEENFLKHEEKKRMEEEFFKGYEDIAVEKEWEKTAKESIEEIERMIDEGIERKKKVKEEKKFEEEIKKEIVYSTKNGYILKVTKDDKIDYYLITKVENIEEAIDKISFYKPIIEEK
ncbi:MAG: hypothetical protein H5T44_00295 [Thermoplasmatales archaeon]|nr:hypothetical protein [Thermoplasmatales archaeon]